MLLLRQWVRPTVTKCPKWKTSGKWRGQGDQVYRGSSATPGTFRFHCKIFLVLEQILWGYINYIDITSTWYLDVCRVTMTVAGSGLTHQWTPWRSTPPTSWPGWARPTWDPIIWTNLNLDIWCEKYLAKIHLKLLSIVHFFPLKNLSTWDWALKILRVVWKLTVLVYTNKYTIHNIH